ncbi:MAG: outer membrane protein assembly factor BamD [Proteobacteria bacterium]|nr:outer membrane protein assembly factor BamD [Pseudomonadota bacterium]
MKNIVLGLALVLLASCAATVEKKEMVGKDSALYNKGMNALYSKRYETAINFFEELDRQHPYSELSQKARVMTIFAHFENESYEETVFEANSFIQENIGYKDLDYVYYMKGLSHYYRISDVKRDQQYTKLALEAFKQLTKRFSKSKYSKEVKQKINLCYDNLAGKEMEIGRFYQSQGNMLAAVNRFQRVVKMYEKSSHAPEALYRIAEVHIALGIEAEAIRALSILGYNYSGSSKWYKKGYDLVKNIDSYEKKYKDEKWYKEFSENVDKIFD